MQYQVVMDLGTATFPDREQFDVFAKHNGFTPTGTSDRDSLRPELRGLPTYSELAGPMWNGSKDGVACIRYETWPVYRAMSQ